MILDVVPLDQLTHVDLRTVGMIPHGVIPVQNNREVARPQFVDYSILAADRDIDPPRSRETHRPPGGGK